jgi:hypothetical protein
MLTESEEGAQSVCLVLVGFTKFVTAVNIVPYHRSVPSRYDDQHLMEQWSGWQGKNITLEMNHDGRMGEIRSYQLVSLGYCDIQKEMADISQK